MLGHFCKIKKFFLPPWKVKILGEKWLNIEYPPIFHPFFFQNDSEWLEMDFKHNFLQCNILTHETPPPPM